MFYSHWTHTVATADAGSPYPFLAVHLYSTVSLGVPGRLTLYRVSADILDNTVESLTLVHSIDRGAVPVALQIRVTFSPSRTGTGSEGRVTVGDSIWRKHISRKQSVRTYSKYCIILIGISIKQNTAYHRFSGGCPVNITTPEWN